MSEAGMVQFLLDQLQDSGVTARSMFGGHGIYRNGRMFALVYDEVVYMKVSEDEAKSSGREPFRPRPSQTLLSYREVSADELEDPALLASLFDRAYQAASGSK